MAGFHLITVLTAVPLVGSGVLLLRDGSDAVQSRRWGYGFSLAALVLGVLLGAGFEVGKPGFQFEERYAWIPGLGIEYRVGVDGLGLVMVLLTSILVPFALAAMPASAKNPGRFHGLMLLLQSTLFGTFTALNFFHWFLFWELSLVPAFFLIRLWGGPRRAHASIQFFVYTMVGSVGLLLAFVGLYAATGTFDFSELSDRARSGALWGGVSAHLGWYAVPVKWIAMILFGLALLGMAVKVPMFPFHTWLPLAYAEAPSAVTMVLTGLMSKMGVYGLLRLVLPIFHEQIRAALAPLLGLAVFTIVLSALAALRQTDLKRILAYSSINHLGYCLLGLFAVVGGLPGDVGWVRERAVSLNGVVLQMVSHGLIASLLFYFVALIERRSEGLRGLDDFGGIRQVAPVFAALMGVGLFASLGLPGLSGFVGEFLIFKGVFAVSARSIGVSLLGLLLSAVFLIRVNQRVFDGGLAPRWRAFPELTLREGLLAAPVVLLIVLLGIYPQAILQWIDRAAVDLLAGVGS